MEQTICHYVLLGVVVAFLVLVESLGGSFQGFLLSLMEGCLLSGIVYYFLSIFLLLVGLKVTKDITIVLLR